MAGGTEQINQRIAHVLIILDQQQGLRGDWRQHVARHGCSGLGRCQWQQQGEATALTRRTGQTNVAAGLPDETIDAGKPQPAAGPRLGGEEGVEDALTHRFVHAVAGVGHVNADHLAVSTAAQAQGAAVGHGVTGVDGEVQQGIFQLSTVNPGAKSRYLKFKRQRDALPDAVFDEISEILDERVDFDNAGRKHLPPGKGQQALRQGCAAFGGRQCAVGKAPPRIGKMLVLFKQVEVAGNGGQQVVEIVGNAAGELSQHFHFLCLPQLRLDHAALGQITVKRDKTTARHRVAAEFNDPAAAEGEFKTVRFQLAQGVVFRQQRRATGAIANLRGQQGLNFRDAHAALDGCFRQMQERRILSVPGQQTAFRVKNRQPVFHAFDDGGQQSALFANLVSHAPHRAGVVAEHFKSTCQGTQFVAASSFRCRLLGVPGRQFAHHLRDADQAADQSGDDKRAKQGNSDTDRGQERDAQRPGTHRARHRFATLFNVQSRILHVSADALAQAFGFSAGARNEEGLALA